MNQIDHLSLEKPIQEKIENLGKIKNLFPQHADYCDTTWIIHGDKNPNPPFGTYALYDEK